MSSVQCVVTSTPYWGMRVYEDMQSVVWADGDVCPYGHEQTPEGFVRHTVEMLVAMSRVLTDDGSIWWNVMDTFMTRTQIRGNAAGRPNRPLTAFTVELARIEEGPSQ